MLGVEHIKPNSAVIIKQLAVHRQLQDILAMQPDASLVKHAQAITTKVVIQKQSAP